MSLARSHYDILGVSPTATAREIRAAYVRLMKRYHPDAASSDDGAADVAPALNLGYAVLRDPETRSRYDAELLRSFRAPLVIPQRPYPVAQQPKAGWTIIVLAIAFGFVILISLFPASERKTREFFAAAAGWMSARSPPTVADLSRPVPDAAETRRIADLARKMSARDAEQFSRRCFAMSAQPLNPEHADGCILFDVAFLYWQKSPAAGSSSAHFADQTVEHRHREAVNAFGANAELRLRNLRQRAFRALIEGIKDSRLAAPSPKSLAAQDPQLQEVQAGERERLAEASVP